MEQLAREDTIRVDLDKAATQVEKAHTKIVQALVNRNEGKYADTKLLLEKELPHVEKDSVFATVGASLLMEANDPGTYLLNRVVQLQSRGQSEEALRLLQTSIDSVQSEARPRLLGQRALLSLDQLLRRGKGSISSNDPLLEKARNDAGAAGECAEAKYVLGRIAEEMENPSAAKVFYDQAIGLSKKEANVEKTAVYHAAMIRVLAIPRRVPHTTNQATPQRDRSDIGKLDAPHLSSALALTALSLQPGVPDCVQPQRNAVPQNEEQNENTSVELPWLASRQQGRIAPIAAAYAQAQNESVSITDTQREIMQHADAILAEGESAPFNARAVALAAKGEWTDGLLAYAEGLRTRLPGEYSQGLLLLIRNHPLLKQVANRHADPVAAEVLYRQGVALYFQRDYPEAERLLTRSIEASDQNALVHYFQGLTQLAQGRTAKAYKSFESGAVLEQAGKPGETAVGLALERVQGNPRKILGWFRNRVEP